MVKPEQKYKIDDVLRDRHTGKAGQVTAVYWSEGDAYNKAEWAYSIDHMGWRFIGESDLEYVQPGIPTMPIWDAMKELTKGVEVDLNAPLEDDE